MNQTTGQRPTQHDAFGQGEGGGGDEHKYIPGTPVPGIVYIDIYIQSTDRTHADKSYGRGGGGTPIFTTQIGSVTRVALHLTQKQTYDILLARKGTDQ